MTSEELLVELSTATGGAIDAAKWAEILQAPPALQEAILANYRAQDWADPATQTGERLLAILGTAAAVAGGVGAIAGVAGAMKALFGR